MLNIGKLRPGGEDYYLATVASTVHDYYTGRGEAPGRWLGHSAERLGLDGLVEPDALRAILGARTPDGQPLSANSTRSVPGFDLTFRAPKSVSLMWALSDPEIARQTRDAHDRAVEAAVGYLERHAARTRRGAGGSEQLAAEGFVAAAFRHRTSRADDPLLHTHVLVANLAHTADDGRWRSLDSRHLYWQAKTAGYLYQAQLRAELTRRLGVGWQPVTNGYADIAGVPRPVIEAFSRRRSQVVDELARVGHRSARAAQIAALSTRRPKSHAGPDGLRRRWRSRARQHDITRRNVRAWTSRRTSVEVSRQQLDVAADRLLGPHGLTATSSTFDRRDAIQGWCEQLRAGADVGDIEQLADALLDGTDVVELAPTTRDGVLHDRSRLRSADGRDIPVTKSAHRYSTPELLAVESRLVATAHGRHAAGVATVPPRLVEAVIAGRRSLRAEQADAVRRLATSGTGIDVLVGRAGTGKTYALGVARQAWQAAGVPVYGCALAARAARELQAGSGIRATTIHRLLGDLTCDERAGLTPGSVLVVDEAGMVGTRTLARLVDVTTAADAKLVLVGDHHQLPEIDAGGVFRHLATALPAVELTVNRRQHEAWERDALDELRHGAPTEAVAAYARQGRLLIGGTADELREQLVSDWWEAVTTDGLDAVIVAARRDDIDDLNSRARHRLAAAGLLTGPAISTDRRDFRVGDRILCLRNHRDVGVLNGTRGTVVAVAPDRHALTFVRDDSGEPTWLPAAYLDAGWVDHGYALTAHKAQGLTCDATFVLATDEIYREWGYVALSRGRHFNRLYRPGEPDPDPPDDPTHPQLHQDDSRQPTDRLTADLQRSHQQRLAIEHLPDAATPPPREVEPTPEFLRRALGERPADPDRAGLWDSARSAIEDYRHDHGITDDVAVLGPPPSNPADREARRCVVQHLLAARRELFSPTASRTQGRDLDLDLSHR